MSSLMDVLKTDIELYISKFIDEIAIETNINKNKLHEIWMNVFNNNKIIQKSTATVNKKKTVSAYVNFCNQQRPSLKEKYPNLSFGDISKQLGKLWSELSPDEQNKYKILLDDDKTNIPSPPVIEKTNHEDFIFYDDKDDDDESLDTFIIDDDDDFELETDDD